MQRLTVEKITEMSGGRLLTGNGLAEVDNVVIDSRKAGPGSVFLTFKGEKNDAHRFIPDVLEKGCRALMVTDENQTMAAISGIAEADEKPAVILVKDVKDALTAMARSYLGSLSCKKIAVTGSTGKTSTKDMLYFICSEKYKTARTQGNHNNDIGLPLTVTELPEDTEVAIFEMGMSSLGEIHHLADIVRPDVGIITNVGITHIEHLGSRENILQAKLEIRDFFEGKNLLIISDTDDILNSSSAAGNYELETVGFNGKNQFIISDINDMGTDGLEFSLERSCHVEKIHLPVPGVHNAMNASLAIAAAEALGIDMDTAKVGLEKMSLTAGRLSMKGKNGIKVIDDTYNASPASMKAGLDVLAASKGVRRVAILGDMYELGENSLKYHREVGKYAAEKKIDRLVAVGESAGEIAEGAKEVMEKDAVKWFRTKEDFMREMSDIITVGDVVLVKGSRGMKMEEIVNKILE